jgi:protein ImuA
MSSLEALRTRIRAIEAPGAYRAASLGAPALDAALPWGGLPRGCLHEIAGMPGDAGAALGFAAALVTRLRASQADAQENERQVLWCLRADTDHEIGAPYAPGLRSLGLAAQHVLLVRTATTAQVLWAMEEGLRAGGLAAVVGEVDDVDLSTSRRLQLAAEARGVTALLIVPALSVVSGAVTRWQLSSRGGGGESLNPRWHVELTRCRGGAHAAWPSAWPVAWEVEWSHATRDFAVVAGIRDRSPELRASLAQAAG